MTVPYCLIPGGYVDATGPHRGDPPTQEDYDRHELHHRLLFGPYDAVVTQELPVEDVKKLYPDAHIPEHREDVGKTMGRSEQEIKFLEKM